MQISVLVERVAGNGFRARTGEPLALTAEGATREEALRKLRDSLDARLGRDTELVSLEVPKSENPWVEFAGMFKDEPMFDEVVQIMSEQRRRDNADPDYV